MTDQIPALRCEPGKKSAASPAPSEIWASPNLSEAGMEFIEILLKEFEDFVVVAVRWLPAISPGGTQDKAAVPRNPDVSKPLIPRDRPPGAVGGCSCVGIWVSSVRTPRSRQAYAAAAGPPPGPGRLLKAGAAVLIAGALLLLAGAIGAFYFWKATERQVYNVHYTMSINGKVQDGSMEIDAGNNLETFKTGSGSEEAVEVHDFQIGITGIRFAEGEKCYIKAQPKAHVPEVDAMTKASLSSELEDEIMPVRFDENSLIWVAADEPIKHNSFLSPKILELCGDLPIFWLRPTYPKDNQRREMKRNKRQSESNFDTEDLEAATEKVNTRLPTMQLTQELDHQSNETRPMGQETDQTLNPDNPYNQLEGEGMAFDPMLDHLGVCCIECRRSYTQCQRICEPLLGYYPWPYNYQGCRTACRIIMPCSWWVARIMGVV
ncbi:PREDICTED: leukocyte cell-derived chemotaxin 1 [Haliaeetus leucocephalus]|uniref:leukocyte cell-derived chemotaxin 1 n=1 Tax=Haliaeetus leucocephalus TaxID=52644 RepID=UPI00053CD5EE|nr:PREDICTED: leukocyte cell-derived chemotaxin 1 [Haliaeetus leucocephalus]